jgi:hypothetical protein
MEAGATEVATTCAVMAVEGAPRWEEGSGAGLIVTIRPPEGYMRVSGAERGTG